MINKIKKFYKEILVLLSIGLVSGSIIMNENRLGSVDPLLDSVKDKLVATTTIDIYDINGDGEIYIKESVVKYFYTADEAPAEKLIDEAPLGYLGSEDLTEDISARTINMQIFPMEENRYIAKIYPGTQFVYDEALEEWFTVANGTTTEELYDATIARGNVRFVNKALAAESTSYTLAGDGAVLNAGSAGESFATVRGESTGTNVQYTSTADNTLTQVGLTAGTERVGRVYMPVDTTALPDNAVISSSTFSLVINKGADANFSYVLIQTTQPDYLTLTTADFNNIVALDTPDEGAARLAVTNASNARFGFNLNSTGNGWIEVATTTYLGFREAQDVDNSSTYFCRPGVTFSEQTGTTSDPYLLVEYTIPAAVDVKRANIINFE